jgi:hypothetical protein
MRHFIRRIALSGAVTALPFGMLNASTTASLVTLTGLAGFAAPGRPRTTTSAVNLAAITAATDNRQGLTTGTRKQSRGKVHRPSK